jgi:myo-inositol 2-dehydrogenase / D-chiro-inositol 1-dehydrogenase
MRIGLAGAGRIGAFHAGVLSRLAAVDSVVVADAGVIVLDIREPCMRS